MKRHIVVKASVNCTKSTVSKIAVAERTVVVSTTAVACTPTSKV
jgi:hypothetical protein